MAHLTIHGENSLQLYYEDSGGCGRPVVLIHGWPLSSQAWVDQVPALTGAGYRVIAYDRRGFGRSGRTPIGYDYETFAADLHALIDELDLTDAVLVGYSMGGGEVARYVAKYGEKRLAGAVFAAAITPALCLTPDNPEGAMGFEGFVSLRQDCISDRDAFLRTFMTWFFSDPTGLAISPQRFDEILAITAQASPEALSECILAWATDFRDDIGALTVPALVIHGNADNNVPLSASGQRTAAAIPGAVLHVISDGPHGINVSHAAEFNKVLLTFLASL